MPPEAYKADEIYKRPVENPSAATCVYFVRPYCVADQVILSYFNRDFRCDYNCVYDPTARIGLTISLVVLRFLKLGLYLVLSVYVDEAEQIPGN